MSKPLTSNTLQPQAQAFASVVAPPTSDPKARNNVASDIVRPPTLRSSVVLRVNDMVSPIDRSA